MRPNFWNDIALINIDTSRLIQANISDNASIPLLRDAILFSYKKEFKRSGTYRNLRAEIDQFEFLTFLLDRILEKEGMSDAAKKSVGVKQAAVNQILNELLKLKNLK